MDKLTQEESFDKPIRLGDRVEVFNKNSIPFKGTIRSMKKHVLGIEMVSYIRSYIYTRFFKQVDTLILIPINLAVQALQVLYHVAIFIIYIVLMIQY